MVGRQTFFPQGAAIGVRGPSSESRVKGVHEKKPPIVALPFRVVIQNAITSTTVPETACPLAGPAAEPVSVEWESPR